MAEKNNRYSNGNAAYDLFSYGGVNVVREREYVLPQEPSQVQEQRVKVVKGRSHVPYAQIVGFMVVTALLLLVVFSYVRLFEVSMDCEQMESRLSALNEQNAQMTAAYNDIIDLNAVKLVATNQLGMAQPTKDQMVYLDLGNEDKAVIVASNNGGVFASALEALSDSVRYILEYFSLG